MSRHERIWRRDRPEPVRRIRPPLGGDRLQLFAPMRKAGLTAAILSDYLAPPTKKVPGARMTIATPNAKDRDDIIAFLGAGGSRP